MIIEYELQGSKCLHKGIMDTTGFWLRYEHEEHMFGAESQDAEIEGYKIYNNSFSFYHENKTLVDLVYARLLSVLRGSHNVEIENIGYLRKVSK